MNARVAKINEVNSKFAVVCKKLQDHYTNIQQTILLHCDETVFRIVLDIMPRMTQIVQLITHDEVLDKFREQVLQIRDSIDAHLIYENKATNRVADVLGNYSNEVFDETFSTSFFDKINNLLEKSTNAGKEHRIGEMLDMYITAICLFEAKIRDEIRFYKGENVRIGEMLRRWTFGNFSWISRSGNGYDSTAKIWESVLENVVAPMKALPEKDLQNYKDARNNCNKIIQRLDRMDLLVEAGINDKFIYSINDQTYTVQIGDTNVITMQSVADKLNTVSEGIQCKYLTMDVNRSIALAASEFTDYQLDEDCLLFIADNKFKIEQFCTIRSILGFNNWVYESTYNERTKKYYIASQIKAPTKDELQMMMQVQKKKKIWTIMDDFTVMVAQLKCPTDWIKHLQNHSRSVIGN